MASYPTKLELLKARLWLNWTTHAVYCSALWEYLNCQTNSNWVLGNESNTYHSDLIHVGLVVEQQTCTVHVVTLCCHVQRGQSILTTQSQNISFSTICLLLQIVLLLNVNQSVAHRSNMIAETNHWLVWCKEQTVVSFQMKLSYS